MSFRTIQLHLGIGALIATALLLLFAIPNWVSSPSNVPKIVLSPVFWPYVLSGFTGLVGLGLVVSGMRSAREPSMGIANVAEIMRLGGMAVLMVATMWLLPRLGMVLTCMVVFLVTAVLIKARHPVAVLITAVLAPLFLYGFFAHVAGVAIPQGDYVSLP